MKHHPLVAELFRKDRQIDRRWDGRTDMTNGIVAFRNFANAPKNNKIKKQRIR
jgi:hypothetical protein